MWRICKLILLYIAYQLAFAGTFTIAYMLWNGTLSMPTTADPGFMRVSILAQALGTLALGIHLVVGKYIPQGTRAKSALSAPLLITAVLFIIGMGCWTNYLSELVGLPDNMEQVFIAMMHNPVGLLSIVVLAPVVEELLFRGAMQGYLMCRLKNPAWGIVIASLIFGAIHGNPAQIPFAFVTGLALGWVYYRTGSLWPGILMHFVNNGSSVLLYYLTGDANATLQGLLGADGAMALALGGLLVTIACVWLIDRKLTPEHIEWTRP